MTKQANILFLFPDQLRWDWVGYLGQVGIRTPNLDKLASQGTAFSCAITPAPLCAPARAALASACRYQRCGVRTNEQSYQGTETGWYRQLQQIGYHTMACGKFDLGKPRYSWGRNGKQQRPEGGSWFDEWGFSDGIDSGGKMDGWREYQTGNACPYMHFLESQGLAQLHIEDFRKRRHTHATHCTPLPDEAYVDNWITSNAINLIDRAPADKPFFLQVNFNGPHAPWDITASMLGRCDNRSYPAPHRPDQALTADEHHKVRRNYAAMIENIDHQVGRLIEHLQQTGKLQDTVIIFSSDHGEMLGDRGFWQKNRPWQASIGVPLVCAGPGIKAQPRISAPTELLDIPATCLELGGADIPDHWDSLSLMPVLSGKVDRVRECAISSLANWTAILDERYKLIIRKQETPVLYDLMTDPGEELDQADTHPEIVDRLTALAQAALVEKA